MRSDEKPPMHLQTAPNSPDARTKLSWVFPTVVVVTQVRTKKLSHAQRKTCVTSHMLIKFPKSQMANITVLNQTSICYRFTNTSSLQGQTDLTYHASTVCAKHKTCTNTAQILLHICLKRR